jgi:hypothetical protein
MTQERRAAAPLQMQGDECGVRTYQGFLGVGRLAGGFFFAVSLRGGDGVWVGFMGEPDA